MVEEANSVNMPCGHGGMCFQCSLIFLQQNADSQNCHICRDKIEAVLKIDVKTVFSNYIRVLESAKLVEKEESDNDEEEESSEENDEEES